MLNNNLWFKIRKCFSTVFIILLFIFSGKISAYLGFHNAFFDTNYKYYIGQYLDNYYYNFKNAFNKTPKLLNKNILPHYTYDHNSKKIDYNYSNTNNIKLTYKLNKISNFCHNFIIYGNPGYLVKNIFYKSNLYLCRLGYISSYNYKTKQPSWVAYRLSSSSARLRVYRNDKFKEDYDVPLKYRSTLKDYKSSGYDRGHLAPYASIDFNKKSAKQSFLLSNISPQKPGLNRGSWKNLEEYERIWANVNDILYIYDGPIYNNIKNYKTIGKNKIIVPSSFFKIIYAPMQQKILAFIFPNINIKNIKVTKYITTVENIQNKTGLKFLTALPEKLRIKLIKSHNKIWKRSYD